MTNARDRAAVVEFARRGGCRCEPFFECGREELVVLHDAGCSPKWAASAAPWPRVLVRVGQQDYLAVRHVTRGGRR